MVGLAALCGLLAALPSAAAVPAEPQGNTRRAGPKLGPTSSTLQSGIPAKPLGQRPSAGPALRLPGAPGADILAAVADPAARAALGAVLAALAEVRGVGINPIVTKK